MSIGCHSAADDLTSIVFITPGFQGCAINNVLSPSDAKFPRCSSIVMNVLVIKGNQNRIYSVARMLNPAFARFNGRIVDSRRHIPQEPCAPRVNEPMKNALLEDGHLTLDEIIPLDLPQSREEEQPDPKNAVEVWHVAFQRLRQQPGVQLTDWIPFVHLGGQLVE
ncbi:hypothetical protein CPB86DRAFT_878055 [Serendipita vermifera]|nr:hypothetical protein CPB86DRAFT_878055 [Serendipita vermifera]